MLDAKLKISSILGKHPTAELHPQLKTLISFLYYHNYSFSLMV